MHGDPANLAERLQSCVQDCTDETHASFGLAALDQLLSSLAPGELCDAVAAPPAVALTPYLSNYIAAMIEQACERNQVRVPG